MEKTVTVAGLITISIGNTNINTVKRPFFTGNSYADQFTFWNTIWTSKLRVAGYCEGTSPGTNEFPAQRASNTEMFPFDDVIMKMVAIRYVTILKMAYLKSRPNLPGRTNWYGWEWYTLRTWYGHYRGVHERTRPKWTELTVCSTTISGFK